MGFQVPDDLVNTSLSLQQVRVLIASRKQMKTLQNRIDALPKKKFDMELEIVALAHTEVETLAADAVEQEDAVEAATP